VAVSGTTRFRGYLITKKAVNPRRLTALLLSNAIVTLVSRVALNIHLFGMKSRGKWNIFA
jgi:hypothetical protein